MSNLLDSLARREIDFETPYALEECFIRLRALETVKGKRKQGSFQSPTTFDVTLFPCADLVCPYTIIARRTVTRRYGLSSYTTASATGTLTENSQTQRTKVTAEVRFDARKRLAFLVVMAIFSIYMIRIGQAAAAIIVFLIICYTLYIEWHDGNKLVERIQEALSNVV